jgi:hypothetical protein
MSFDFFNCEAGDEEGSPSHNKGVKVIKNFTVSLGPGVQGRHSEDILLSDCETGQKRYSSLNEGVHIEEGPRTAENRINSSELRHASQGNQAVLHERH